MDLVTIGITCYNSETSIENCIKSALKQSHLNTEIIIYDDYSTDGSINKINQFKHNSKISLYVGDKNRGVGFARNYILWWKYVGNMVGIFLKFMNFYINLSQVLLGKIYQTFAKRVK